MRNAYVTMIGGTVLIAAVLGGLSTLVVPSGPVSSVSAEDAATASSGTASEQAAALEAAELEARENPAPPSPSVIADAAPEPQSAPSGYQGSAPTPSIEFGDDDVESVNPDGPPPQPVMTEE